MLTITVQCSENAVVLRCHGKIVAGRAGNALRDAVMCHLDKQTIVLDLSGTTAIDASGLGTLLFLHTCACGVGSALKLVGLSKPVRKVLELTRLLYVLDASSPEEIDSDLGEPSGMMKIRTEYLNVEDVTAAPDFFVREEPDEEEDDEPEDDENDDQEEHQNSGYSE